MNTKKRCLIWLFLTIFISLSGFTCKKVVVEETEICSAAGSLLAGADCASTVVPGKTREMNFSDYMDFLGAMPDKIDNTGKVIEKGRGGAICQSSSDFTKMKTALDQACEYLGDRCSYELKQVLVTMKTNLEIIQKGHKP